MKKKETGKTKKMMRILMILAIITSISIGIIACDKKDKPTTGGGGDNTATISGTVDQDGVTLTIRENNPDGKILYGPTAIVGKSYSAKFGVNGRTRALMIFSKSGCNDAAKGIDVDPGTNINVGGESLLCG